MQPAVRPSPEQGPASRYVLCLECGTQLALVSEVARCGCGKTIARPDDDGNGFSYLGPAVSECTITVHEPEHRRMARRSIRMPDDDRVHRAPEETLLGSSMPATGGP
jgi:hypothetical protein